MGLTFHLKVFGSGSIYRVPHIRSRVADPGSRVLGEVTLVEGPRSRILSKGPGFRVLSRVPLFRYASAILSKRDFNDDVFCEYCNIFKNTYFEEHLRTTASYFMKKNRHSSRLNYPSKTKLNQWNLTCFQCRKITCLQRKV